MAKGQKHGNRETKKPKSAKTPVIEIVPVVSVKGIQAAMIKPKKKG